MGACGAVRLSHTGVILADAATGAVNWSRGIVQVLYLGGAALDAVVLSGVTAVMLCELAGEIAAHARAGQTAALRQVRAHERKAPASHYP